MKTMEQRGCGNCAWGVMMGDDEFCIYRREQGYPNGYPAMEEGEVWCSTWYPQHGVKAPALRKAWLAKEGAHIREEHQHTLVGPIEHLHL